MIGLFFLCLFLLAIFIVAVFVFIPGGFAVLVDAATAFSAWLDGDWVIGLLFAIFVFALIGCAAARIMAKEERRNY